MASGGSLMQLDEAIRAFVQPGHAVYFATDAVAAVRAIVRVFEGRAPKLTVMCLRAGASHCGELLEAGLATRLIAASFGIQYPAFRPSQLLGRAYAKGEVSFEFWSLLSLVQRFQAGAQGLPFLPTRSLRGSSMARQNPAYIEIEDPFSHAPVSLVAPLRPDICIVKAAAADADGNAMVAPPFEDDLWPTRAARLGCIVLAENLVSREFMQERAQLVNVPASKVLGVCHVPYASHPQGFSTGLELGLEIGSYEPDLNSYEEYDLATRDPAAFAKWTERYVSGVRSHAQYLERVRQAHPAEPQRTDAQAAVPATSGRDRAVLCCGWLVAELAMQRGYRKLLVGVGQAQAAAAVACELLQRLGRELTLVEGTGKVDFRMSAGGRTPTAPMMLSGTTDVYSTLVGDPAADCLAVLGAAEIDRFGNINSTLARDRLLVGSGGLNDAVSLAATAIVITKADPRKMVERCAYVTAPGTKVEFLVTDDAILRKGQEGTFEIFRWLVRHTGEAAEPAIARARAGCPWNLELSRDALGLHLPAARHETAAFGNHTPR